MKEIAKMLLAIVLCLFGSVESFQLLDVENADVFIQPGDEAELKAVTDYWFSGCTLINNLQQTVCSVTVSLDPPYSPISECNDNIRYKSDGSMQVCQFEVENVQSAGKHHSSALSSSNVNTKIFFYSTLDYGLWTLVMIDWLISTRKITKTFNISPLEPENGKLK